MFRVSILKIWHAALFIGFLFTNLFGQTEYGSFMHGGLNRGYYVYIPDSVQINPPLVIVLHGYDDTADHLMSCTVMPQVADTAGFIACFPQADRNRWNSGIGWPTSNADDVGFISALMDTMHANYGIDLQRIYVCGHSNGGIMTFKLVCEINDRIAKAAAVASPLIPATIGACDSTQSMPMLLMHGTADPVVPYNTGIPGSASAEETLDYWLGMNGCEEPGDTIAMPNTAPFDGCNTEVIIYGDCDDSMSVVFYKMHGAGHYWPGYNHNWPTMGPANIDFKADVELWRFFNSDSYGVPVSITKNEMPFIEGFSLEQNYPNPFNPTTTINYELPQQSDVQITIFDLLGKHVTTLLSETQAAGIQSVQWNASNVPSGMYFYQIKAGDFVQTRKMILLK